jgi:periplasmic divalent cation tolerance protein
VTRPRARVGSARGVRIVLSTAPPRAAARIAKALVKGGTAACVHVLPRATSVYRWKGAVERASESLLVVKTSARAVASCLDALRAEHPYEVPEALVITPNAGLTNYVRWVERSALAART